MKLPFIKAGEIVTTHGVRGEVKVLPWLDSPEDLCDFDRCRIDGKEYTISDNKIGALTQKLYNELTAIQWGKAEDKFGWSVKVCNG
jgi:ribosomal 30S subunit maturation factor RimM